MKKRLPTLRAAPANPAAREQLAAWLRAWNIERALAADDGPARPAPIPERRRGRRRPARAGEVRLLRPDTPAGFARPRYFLVLDIAADGTTARIAPFSRFRVPAFPGEWRTRHPATPLAVLCPWNAREAPLDLVERTWPVTVFETERLAAARRAAEGYIAPDLTPAGAPVDEVGPPLGHPDDPRWGYLEEEALAWDGLADDIATGFPLVLRDRTIPYGSGSEPALPLAAEPKPDYRPPGRKAGQKRDNP